MTTIKHEVAQPLVIERTFKASASRIWRALTNVDEMREWYFDLKAFEPKPGFEFEFTVEHDGNTFHHLCRITEAIPEKKVAYTWRYAGEPGESLVTFELFPETGGTRLRITHAGLETFPRTPQFARKNFEGGWTALASELQRFVENREAND
jgi:uncharacterized protein YndB with AHSA1/START domain